MCKAVCVVHLCQVVLTNYFLGLLFFAVGAMGVRIGWLHRGIQSTFTPVLCLCTILKYSDTTRYHQFNK